MRRFFAFVFSFSFVFLLSACGGIDKAQTDELSIKFIEALLLRDEEAMKQYVHPEHINTAIPGDEFYNELEENHFFTVGNKLTALDSVGKNYVEKTELTGTVLQCKYVARTNELFYDIELIILENDNGYGIVAVSAKLNTDPTYYKGSEIK